MNKPVDAKTLRNLQTADITLEKLARDLRASIAYRVLEPRMAFDAAMVATAATVVDQQPAAAAPAAVNAEAASAQQTEALAGAVAAAPAAPGAAATHDIVFVDSTVPDYQSLLANVPAAAEVVVIDGAKDGLHQIAEYLAGRSGIDSVHVLSHGDLGTLLVGSTVLTLDNVDAYAADLAAIGSAISANGDLLLYGCDVAMGDKGAQFIDKVAQLTGADVAASKDATGSAERGGNWELEARTGTIEAAVIDARAWDGELAPISFTNTTNATTLANTIKGAAITVNSATFTGQTGQAATFTNASGYTPAWLGFSDGILLTTGSSSEITTANTSGNGGQSVDYGTSSETSLNALAGQTVNDPATLTLNFTPTSSKVTVQFTFGSDEYLEYVNSGYNDVMGIWVNGVQKALLPDGSAYTINTINSTANKTLYKNNPPSASPTYSTGMDGFTVTVSMIADVNIGVANTIKFGIADVGDGSWDSWLFIRANSFEGTTIANTDTAVTGVNTPVTINALANDTDSNGYSLGITGILDKPVTKGGAAVSLPSGATVALSSTGQLIYTPANNSTAGDIFTYTIDNGNGTTALGFVTVTVKPLPVAGTDTFTTGHDAPVTVNVLSNDTSPNGGALTITGVNGANIIEGGPGVSVTGGTVTLVAGKLVFTPTKDYIGSPSFTYTVKDSLGMTGTGTVNGSVTNAAPALDLDGNPAATLTVSNAGAFSQPSIDAGADRTNTLTFTEPTDALPNTTALTATLKTIDDAFKILVNGVSISSTTFIVDPSSTATGTLLKFADNSTVVSGWVANSNGLPRLEVRITPTGIQLWGTKTSSSAALEQLTYTGTLTQPTFVVGTNTVAIINVNGSGPESIDGVLTATVQRTSYATTYKENGAAVAIADTDASITDVDDTNMESAVVTLTNAQTGDRLLVNGATTTTGTLTGGITYVLSGNTVTLTGSATKAQYAAALALIQFDNTTDTPATTPRTINVTVNDGSANSNTAVTTINIDLAPDPVNDTFVGNQNGNINGNVLTNDTDVGTTPSIANPLAVVTGPANGTLVNFNTSSGSFVYKPSSTFSGTDTFTYSYTDGNGDAKTATVTLTVNAVNTAPVNTVPGAQSTAEDTAKAITGISVSDADGATVKLTTTLSLPAGAGTLKLASTSSVTVSGDGSGTVTITGTAAAINAAMATVTYTPTADYNTGSPATPINLTVSTSDGGAAAVVSTVAITVTPVADIAADSVTTNEDTAVTFAPFANDSFENAGATISAINGTAITAGGPGVAVTGGTVTLNSTGNLTFTPNANYNGTPSFNYTVTSGGTTETASVSMTVTPVNDAPVNTLPAAQSTAEDTAKVISGISVADVDNATLTTTLTLPAGAGALTVSAGSGATISGDGTGTVTISGTTAQINAALAAITFTPTKDYNGAADITVATSDGSATTTSTLSLTVSAVADITNDTIGASEDTAKTFNVLAGTNDATADSFENSAAAVTAVTQPANGTVTFSANGAITYTPNANFNGTDTFTYTVTSGGVTETATVTVNVAAVNDAPVNTVPGAQTVAEDTSIVFSQATGTAITIADVDSSITTTLTVANAKLTLGSVSGVTVTGNGTGTVTVSGTPAAVTAALNGLALAPSADWNGTSSLSISTSDGVAPAVVDTVAITVTPVIDIAPNTASTAEDTAKTFNVLTNDNFENAGAVVSSVTQPAHGTVTFTAAGNVTYTPAANYNGTDSFTYTVTSGGVTETTTVSMTVTAVNDAPTVNNIFARTSTDGATTSYAVGGFFSDVDGDTLTFSATGLPAGLSINSATGQISGTLGKSASTGIAGGIYAVSVTATDPSGASVTRTFNWTVTNPAPVAGNDTFTGSEDTPLSGNLLSNDSDPDGDALSVVTTPAVAPQHGTVLLNANGTFTYTPDANYNGSDSFTYTLKDADGATATATVSLNVNPVNDTPAIGAPAKLSVNEDTPLAFTGSNAITISDADSGQSNTTTVTVTNGALTLAAHPGVTITGSGTGTLKISGLPADVTAALADMTYKAPADYNGPATLTVSSTDGIGTNSTSVALTVSPVADITPDSVTTNEDTSISFNVLTGTNGATADSFSDSSASVTSVTQPSHGSVTIGASGVLTYTPTADYNGADSFTYTVTSGGVSETTTVTIGVTAVNDKPTQTLPSAQTGKEDTNVVFSGAKGNQIVIGDIDSATVTTTLSVPAGQLTAIATTGVTIVGNGSGTVTLSGTPAAVTAALNGLVYTPVADASGSVAISVSTTDGTATSTPGSITIDLAPVTDIVADAATTNEDTPITVSVLGNDTFENSGAAVTAVTNGAHGTVIINANGTVTYTPAAKFNGSDSFSYTVTSGGVTETAVVTVIVNAVNDAPVTTVPAAQTVAEDGSLMFGSANGNALTVADVDSNVATTLSVTNGTLNLSPAAGVTITGDGTGKIVVTGAPAAVTAALNGLAYHPTPDYSGSAILTVTTSDGSAVDSKTVALTITPVVDIADDAISTNEDTPVTVKVTANDSFENGNAAISAVTQPSHGTVSIGTGGQITYTPSANYNGPDSFTYTVTSGGVTETATVTVTVAAVNDAPVVSVPPGQSTGEDTNLVLSSANGNAINITDVDSADTISIILSSTNGTLTLGSTAGISGLTGNGTNLITLTGTPAAVTAALNGLAYAPASDYVGAAAITMTTSDGTATATSTIAIAVTPVADIVADTVATNEGSAVTFNVLTGTNGASADTFESAGAYVSGITKSSHGTVSYLADGTFVYTPNALWYGTDTFTYTVTSGGNTETTTVTVNVAHVNHAPTTSGILDQTGLDGAAVSLNVAASFADVDSGDALTYAITAGALPAGLSLDANTGLISGTIDKAASQAGPYSITVTASDGNGGSVATTFAWTISNPGPTATNDIATVVEDGSGTVDVLANDSDPDKDTLTIVAGSAVAGNGTVTVNPDNTITYTPKANFNGTDTIVYKISDGNGGFSTASVTVTVTPVNDAPTTTGLADLLDSHGFPLTALDISGAFADIDHDTLQFSVDAANALPPGVSMSSSGVISGTPTTDGDYPVTIIASDGHGGTVSTTFTWKIVNVPPTASDDNVTTNEDQAVVISPLANDVDPQGDPIHITTINGVDITTAPGKTVTTAHGSVKLMSDAFGNDVLVYTPAADFNGVESIVYGISDGNTGTDTAVINITVNPVNDAPTADALANLNSNDGDAVSLGAAPFFHDIDKSSNGDTLTFSAVGLPSGVSINASTGVISGTIDAAASQSGPYTVVVKATDSAGATVSQSFTWSIANPKPTATNDTATLAEGAASTIGAAAGLVANDTDPDHDSLVVAAVNGSAGSVSTAISGSKGGLFTVAADGSYTFNQNGAFEDLQSGETRQTQITYTVSDGNGGTSTATLTITVQGANDAPVASSLANISTKDGAAVSLNAGGAFSDVDGDTLTFSIDPAHPLPAGLSINASTGMITGTLATSASQGGVGGVYSVSILANDGNGGVTPVTMTITVANVAPMAGDDTASTLEDTAVTASVAGNDSDPDGDALTWVKASDPAHGSVVMQSNGTYTYTPAANFNGTDSFTYTVTDADGAATTRTVTITVGAVNDAPVATGPATPQTVNDGQAINTSIASLFSDVDGDKLTYSVSGLPAGLSLDAATGQVTGKIDASASQVNGGVYTVVYTATDPSGKSVSVTLAMTVLDPAPTSVPLANAGTTDGSTVTLATAQAFSDPDGDTLTYSATGLPAGLSINASTGLITGTLSGSASVGGPANNGIYTITVTANDGQGGTVSRTFSYTVSNPAPVALSDAFTGNEDATVSGTVASNDSDPDGDTVSFQLVSGPAHGTLVFNANGSFTYTPNANANDDNSGGADSFVYRIVDANGATATATATLSIQPVNDAPGPKTATASGNEDTAITGTLPASDVDKDDVTFSISTAPAHGKVSLTPDGSFVYTPDANYNGTDTFVVLLDDGNGGKTLQTVTVSVAPVNDAPVAKNDAASVPSGVSVTIPVLSNDTDIDGDKLTVTAATATGGNVTVNPDGTLTFKPAAGFSGQAVITYTVSDGNGGTATATVTVNVAPEVIPPVASAAPPAAQTLAGSQPFVIATGAVIDAVDGTGLTGFGTGLDGNGVVLASVNGANQLGGIGMMNTSRGVIAGEVLRVGRVQALAQTLADTRLLHGYDVTGLTGFSLRFDFARAERHGELIFETLIRDRTLIVQLSDTFRALGQTVLEYRIMQADGRPLPNWLDMAGRSTLIGERPVGVESIRLRVVARLSDGTSVVREVEIQTQSGEIKPLEQNRRSDMPDLFSRKLRTQAMLSPREVEHLARALAG